MSTNPIDILRRSRGEASRLSELDLEEEISNLPPALRAMFAVDRADVQPGGRFDPDLRQPNVGIGGALKHGVVSGVLEPLKVLGVETKEVELDEPGEQVANFLGSMVGLGISFIPFMYGAGIALRGIGLTKNLASLGAKAGTIAESLASAQKVGAVAEVAALTVELKQATQAQALFNFVRNTAAGSVQFSGTSESLAEVPVKAAQGAAFGVAIEGLFLAKAMRGRRGAVGKGNVLDTGSPVPDNPVGLDRQALESQISPSASKTAERITTELNSTFTKNSPYAHVVVDLVGDHVESVRVPGLSANGVGKVLAHAEENFPSAQRLSRPTSIKGIHEVLIHEPFDPTNKLTPQQISEWKTTGFASGQEVIYAGRAVEATGAKVAPGFVQVRMPYQKGKKFGVPFSVLETEITRPVITRFFNPSAARVGMLKEVVKELESSVGFVVPASTVGRAASLSARRGSVDVSEFATATTFNDFAKPYMKDIASVQAATPEEAVGILAARQGIPGLQIMDDGIPARIHIFDQKRVSYVTDPPQVARTSSELRPIGRAATDPLRRPFTSASRKATREIERQDAARAVGRTEPNLGLTLDDAVFSTSLTGEPQLSSFTPSWRNSIGAPLRDAGFPEKEINQILDMYAANQSVRLDALMDPEFQAIKNAATFKFGGCL